MLNPSMNGSPSSEDKLNSSLLRRNLRRKPETKAGEVKASHSGVEFSDDKHRPMYYASSHGRYDPGQTVLSYKADPGFVLSNKPVKRKKIPYIPSRTGGVVGPELDRSVLVRNIPIIFVKQFEAARWKVRHYKGGLISKVYETLFGHRVTLPDEYRPKHGCFPTINWDDVQIKTWTEFAHWMGIQYHGKHEYSFPKGTLGKVIADTYYTNPTSKWPWPFEKGYSRDDLPYFDVHSKNTHKRSDSSRVLRSFKKIKKLVVKPIDISSFLQERRVIPRRQISAEWNKFRGCTFKQYRDSIPYCLTVNVRNTFPVSSFMLETIKKLFSRVSKLIPTLPWVPRCKPEFSEPIKVVPSVESIRRHKARLTATLGGDGRVYLTRAKIASVQSVPFSERRRTLSVLSSIQSEIDKDEDTFVANHGVSFSLGDWEF